ncbi:HD domain-containing protein [Haliea sp. AH-315-K21]|uniref:HD domain-containing protein n=1 Tax=SAR86 cluster bacterium TaxID=2030880 RepID=A0A2A5CGB5_9GAMM|nr:HD domain-containing protein [Haliea sp. AH-315-K21]PCJ42899.1 MAG: hypothetical protein COA71_05230 [SAR86 cluster bacterium]
MNSTNTKTLVKDPGCLHACQMIPRFIGLDMRMAKRKLQLKLGMSKLISLVPDAYRIPDSTLAQQATELVREISDDMLLNHCYRTYLFGCILAHQDGLKFDREVFYLSSIMHDIGLSEKHAADPGSFEYVGAKVAHEFCLDHDYDAEKSALVHDAIALHSAVGIAHKEDPEIALVHFGAGVDVIGIHYAEIPKYALTEILEQYPRLDYKNLFVDLINKQVELKPKSHIATHMKLGFGNKVKQTPFSE